MADIKETDALLELERRMMTGDSSITPEIGAKIKTKLEAYRAQGVVKPLSGDGGGKPLPAWAATPYEKQVGIYGSIKGGLDSFKDDFAGNTVTGGLENAIQGRASSFGTEGQRDWWAQFGSTDNVIRNDLFGAALTESEKAAYAATTVEPSMDPKEVKKNLTSRRDILKAALTRRTNFLKAQGYSREAIEALSGEFAADLGAVVAPPEPPPADAPTPPADPLDPTGEGDIGFASKASAEANSLPQGAQEFQRDLSFKIARGELKTPDDVVAFAASSKLNDGRGFVVNPEEAKAVLDSVQKGGQFNVDTPRFQKPDISDVRGEGGLTETGRAFARGIPAVLGVDDELGAIADTMSGGTLRENLARNRAIRDYDEENNFGARTVGALAGGLALPTGVPGTIRQGALAAARTGVGREAALATGIRAGATRGALEGGAYSGAYGFGASDGDFGDRLLGGATAAPVGALGGYGLVRGGGAASARFGGRRPPTGGGGPQETMEAARRLDIDLLPADVGGPMTRRLTAAAAQAPLSAGPIIRGGQRVVDQAQGARDRIAGTVGNAVDPEAAGETARRGAEAFTDRTGRRGGDLYDRARRLSGDRRVVALNGVANIDQHLTELGETAATSAPEINALQLLRRDLMDDAGNPIPLRPDAIRRLRSNVRAQAQVEGLRGTDYQRRANQVLDAVSDDIATDLPPEASRAFRTADRYWRNRLRTIDEVLEPIVGKGEKSGEQIVTSLNTAARGNTQRLLSFVRALPPAEGSEVRATMISQLGRASAGTQNAEGSAFSLNQFLTHWNQITPRAKSVFGPDARAALNDLARVAEGSKQAAGYANRSNTGGAVAGNIGALLGIGSLAPTMAAAAGTGQLITGRLLSSPRFARWLARAPRQRDPNAAIEQLSRIASREPAIAQEITGLQNALMKAANDNTSIGSAAASGEEREGQQQ